VDAYVETDTVTDTVRRTTLRYHRGHYDAAAGEFRGFERVELGIVGDDHAPTVEQVTTFEQGDPADPAPSAGQSPEERAAARALHGRPLTTETYEIAADGTRTRTRSATMSYRARLAFADGDRFVHVPERTRTETRIHALGEPDRIDVAEYEYDEYRNVTRRIRRSRFDDQPADEAAVSDRRMRYVDNEADWLVGLRASETVHDGDGRLHAHTRRFYDGEAFHGLPAGEATSGLLTRKQELVLADWALPDGYADEIDPSWGLTHEGEGYYREATAVEFDDAGRTVGIRESLGVEHRIEYDDEGFPTRLLRAVGTADEGTVSATYDRRTGQPTSIEYPEGAAARYDYSPLGRLRAKHETTSDGSLALTGAFTVDYGDPTASPPQPPSATSYEPREAGWATDDLLDVDAATLSGVDVAREFYDGRGNRLQQVRTGNDAADGSTRWIVGRRSTYTVRGETGFEYPNAFVDTLEYHPDLPTDGETAYHYDGTDSLTRVERADGTAVRIERYPDRIERWEPGVSTSDPPIVERLTARGDLAGVERPTGDGDVNVTTYDRDLRGRIVSITDATGRVATEYTYAGSPNPIRIDHADAGRRTFWYDAADNRRLRTDALGQRLSMRYDDQGRLVEAVDETDPAEPTTVRTKTYDGTRLVETTDGDVTVSFGYDAAGRRTERTVSAGDDPELAVGREFTVQGDLAAITYPDGTRVAYDYGDHGSPVSVSGFVDRVTYDAHERPTEVQFAGSASTSYTYDHVEQDMTAATLTDGSGNTLRSLDYEYDAGGNVTAITDDLGGETLDRRFEYDRLFRLTAAEQRRGDPGGEPDRRDEYAYTPTGDLTRNDESMDGPMRYADADHAGRLTAFTRAGDGSPTSVSYDAGGRVTGYGDLQSLEYDIWDRLVAAERADGTVVTFDYDADGNRVSKTVTEGTETRTTTYVGDRYRTGPDGERLTITIGELTVAVRTTSAGDDDSRTAHVLTDHLGSIVAACDPTGTVVHQQVYSPFGRRLRPHGEHDRYIGLDADDGLGLTQFGDRYYAPELGRFITPDWFIIENPQPAIGHPQGLNAYSYAVNNPMRFRDPTGKFAFLAAVAIGAAAGFAVGFVGGTVYGLSQGDSLGQSMLRGLEAGLLGVAGGALGAATGGLVFGVLGFPAGVGAAIGGVFGALNGYISGATQIYRWSDGSGFADFLSDSTWGLVGTSLGVMVHLVNWTFYGGGNYAATDSHRSNHHIYDGGVAVKSDYAFTQGNVISNLQGNRGDLYRHEQLHVMQSRVFGPVFQGVYAGWLVAGAAVGFGIGLFTDQDLGQDIEDVAYFNNPWETWAYSQEGPRFGSGREPWGDLAWL
jgi:RHS repeat-associated protein